ncbi:siderophore-interacting protein [Ruegeria sp. Ofav3-42]|uniref:siderophore-interacting protein n=1 Tax=Ruegeria sp. Ofav3-42 TaxID=2917759 RepID=UPI001EF43AD4|nr:siderophore-interacting protein [Ruegeria sp. Ofav3-42]MCG7521545.1 siderophore-interacting protein [Ruegeria sp. Ofav3-42]
MTIRPDFSLIAETHIPELDYNVIRQLMLHEAKEHALPVLENEDTRVSLETPFGCYSFEAAQSGVTVKVTAAKQDWLFMLKEQLIEHLVHFLPDAVGKMRWSDAGETGSLPPNFQFATVQKVTPVGTSFVRVRVKACGLSSFQDDAIHFRIVLPPKGTEDAEWPHVSENGSTVWPNGDNALHRPAYTTRWIDHAMGLMDFDVFVHEGGRVTEWVQSVELGSQVAIVGPGGGGIPDTNRILMYADETALPALARILEALPADTLGHVTALTENGANCAYPLTAPPGVSVMWLDRNDGHSLAELALRALEEFQDHFLWFACDKADAQRVRAAYKAKSGDPARAYIAAYWSKSGVAD